MPPTEPAAPPATGSRDGLLEALRAALPPDADAAALGAALAALAPAAAEPPGAQLLAHRRTALQMLTEIADELPVGVLAVSPDLVPFVFNRAARQLLDLPDALFADGLPHFSQVVLFNARRGEYGPGDPEALTEAIVAKARQMQAHRVQRTRPDGTVLDIRGAPMPAGGFCSIWTDVTELDAARRAAQQHERELYELLDSLPGSIGLIGADGLVRMANRRMAAMLGQAEAEAVIGRSLTELLGTQLHAALAEPLARAQAGEAQTFRQTHAGPQGRLMWAQMSLVPRRDAEGRPDGVYAMGVDISALVASEQDLLERNQRLEALNAELERAQQQLMQSEKLASIGQLAAGVAHEINNPVGYVASNAASLERYIADLFELIARYEAAEALLPPATQQALKQAKQAADLAYLREDIQDLLDQSREGLGRVKKIVQDLKDFSRADSGHTWAPCDLEQCLESTLTIAANEIKYKCEVVREFGHPPDVECVASQLNQVFLNMVVNAGHAIAERGRIVVRTGHRGEQAWVEFEDNGCGMAPEVQQRIFEPFFTTKPVGQGTGLGLSLSYGIVHKHHGRIEVDSELGRGTRFRIWLPLKQPAGAVAEAAVA